MQPRPQPFRPAFTREVSRQRASRAMIQGWARFSHGSRWAAWVVTTAPFLVMGCESRITPVETESVKLCSLRPAAEGWINSSAESCWMQGGYYAYNDCKDSPGNCTQDQFPGEKFELTDTKPCTYGTTAAPRSEEERAVLWGAGIGVHLNEVTQAGGEPTFEPVGSKNGILRGFSFDIQDEYQTLEDLRVTFPTDESAETAHFVTIRGGGRHTVWLEQAQQGSWVSDDRQTALDATQVIKLQIQIPSVVGRSINFSLCINELTALLQ